MIRHISVFSLVACPEKEENLQILRTCLERISKEYPAIQRQQLGTSLLPVPPESEGSVLFGDFVQICDFADPEAARAYPASEAHARLMADTGFMIRTVTVIDFEL